jgi:hypothetical protein
MEKSPLEKLLAGELDEQEPMMSVGSPSQVPMMSVNAPVSESTLATPAPAPRSGLQDPGLRQAEAALANLPVDTTKPPKPESQLERLERLAQEMQTSRAKELEDANRRQMYQDMLAGINSNLGLIVGGAQAMNTKAAVQAPKTGEIRQRDLAKEVSERYKGDQEALMEKYKALLKAQEEAKDRALKIQTEEDRLQRLNELEAGRDRRFYAAMGNKEDQQDYKKLEFAQNSFNKDKVVQKSEERIASAKTLRELVTQNTPISAEAAKTFAARASGEVGALSDTDRAAYGGSRAIIGRIEQAMKEAATGTLTEDNKKFMLQLSNSFEQAGIRDIQTSLKKYAKQTVKRMPNMTEQEAAELIRPDIALESEKPTSNQFPRKLSRINPSTGKKESATVNNQSDLEEAMSEGFR